MLGCKALCSVVYMARINIHVPDDLAERIRTAHRKLNVSQVCQEALQAALAAQEPRTFHFNTTKREPEECVLECPLSPAGEDMCEGYGTCVRRHPGVVPARYRRYIGTPR